jgi:hypothetical protein
MGTQPVAGTLIMIKRIGVAVAVLSASASVALLLLRRPPQSSDDIGPAAITERILVQIMLDVMDWHYSHEGKRGPVRNSEEFHRRYARCIRESNKQRSFQVPLDEMGQLVDGWGRPSVFGEGVGLYSRGPNGIDEKGRGDDMVGPQPQMW